MNESKIVHIYRNKIKRLNEIFSIIPPKFVNTETNISSMKNREIHSYRDYKSKKQNIPKLNLEALQFKDFNLSHFNRKNISKNILFQTINNDKKLSLSCKKYKKVYRFNKNNNTSSKHNNNSEKISLKIINDFFKPEETERILKNASKTISRHTHDRKRNNTIQVENKINSKNNNLSYYFPNLFNVTYNKTPEKNLNLSKFFSKNLKDLKYYEILKNLTLIRKNNTQNKNILNSSESKINRERNEPIFIEKVYTFDILKNLRFNFKNMVEKGKHKNFINSFYITRNLKFNNKIK